jgi:hypothetical protein
MKLLLKLALLVCLALFEFAAITYGALELRNVAIAATHDTDGNARETHIWYANRDGELVFAAGNPANPWLQDLNPDAQQQIIRSLMRQKYGWRDAWIAMIFDVSRSALLDIHAR